MTTTHPDDRLRCPKDASLMSKVSVGNVVVDHCARCGAMWFDPYELEVAVRTKGAAQDIDHGAAKHQYQWNVYRASELLCPRDHSPLVTVPDSRQAHVQIELCRQCGGVLLDAGELRDLSEFTLSERLKAFLKR
jgi:Zn-finger nucleic acid-binding protein